MDWLIAGLLLQDGVTTGAVYVLLAVSLVTIFAVTRIIFVPQGEFVSFTALGAMSLADGKLPGTLWMLLAAGLLAFGMDCPRMIRTRGRALLMRSLVTYVALPLAWLALCLALRGERIGSLAAILIACGIVTNLGPVLYRVAFQPIASAPALTLLIAAVALHLLLVGLGLHFFGPEGVRMPAIVTGTFAFGDMALSAQSLLVIGFCVVLNAALLAFFEFTLLGKSLRAVAIHRRGAQLVGIGIEEAGAFTFAIAVAIGSISGALLGSSFTIYYDSGFLLGLKGFVGAIMGGLSVYPMAAFGALVVGVLEAFASFWTSAYKEVIVFTLIIPILAWRSFVRPWHEDGDA